MEIKSKSLFRLILTTTIMVTSLASSVGIGFAQSGGIEITALPPDILCGEGEVGFNFSWTGGSPPYLFQIDFGDGDVSELITVAGTSYVLSHHYIDHGTYGWTVRVEEKKEGEVLAGTYGDVLTLDGPVVTLTSAPSPPVFDIGDDGIVEFTASASGGTPPYQFTWDPYGDGVDESETGEIATFTYTEVGKHQAQVMVIDDCGFSDTATMPVVVADPENACHPTAQKIADGVNSIFPGQAEDLYTCEDIYDIFDGGLTGDQLGFGRMWKAYNLALTMEELTWEDIRSWHLDVGGWGGLLQLDRFADLLEDHDLPELMGLVMSEDYSMGDVRTAVRSVTRFDADLNDALTRIAEGANPGELGQLYKLAQDLEVDPTAIDGYLADGMTLSVLKHSANFADRMDVDWTEIADARSATDSWGDIGQAYRMATEDITAAEILIMGIQEYRKDLRETVHETDKAKREEQQANQQKDKNKNTGEKLAEQFSAELGEVMGLFENGECIGDWACVRKALRKQEQTQTQSEGLSDHNLQTASQISSKYGVSEEEATTYYLGPCSEDWACTRTHFRVLNMSTKETGKPEKTGKPDK